MLSTVAGDSVWLTQRLLAELYGLTVANITQHISSIYEEEELLPEATIKKYFIVQTEGDRQVKRLVDHLGTPSRMKSAAGGARQMCATKVMKRKKTQTENLFCINLSFKTDNGRAGAQRSQRSRNSRKRNRIMLKI